MTSAALPSDALSHAVLRSERTRIIGLLWLLGALAVVTLVRPLVAPDAGYDVTVVPTILLLAATASYETLVLRMVDRRLADGRPVRDAVWVISTVVETQLPTLAIVLLALGGFVRPYQALVAPAGLAYFFLITLSILRLSPWLARLSGIAGAAGYLTVVAYVYASYRRPEGIDFALPVHLTFAVFIVIGGVIAGAVAAELRTYVSAALREAQTRAAKEKLERDLTLARSIQQGLLPAAPPRSNRFAVAGWNQPADETGGDYYDWQELADGRIAIMLADVTGHGVGPALMAAASRAYARALMPIVTDLGSGMSRLNDLLIEDLPPGKLITAAAAVVEPDANVIQLLSAGHGPLLFYTANDGRVQQFDAHGVPFGVMPGMTYGPPQTLKPAPGDLLVLVTDGFFEWENAAGEEFGVDRLGSVIASAAHLPPADVIRHMHDAVTMFGRGTAQNDDLTAVVIKRTS